MTTLKSLKLPILFFLIGSLSDLLTSWFLFERHERGLFLESNPFANFFYTMFGVMGLMGYKAFFAVEIPFCCCFINRKHPGVAKALLYLGGMFVGSVAIYAVWLYFAYKHML